MWFYVLFPTFLFLFYLRRKSQHRLFKSLGIPGPEPNWFFGNLLSFNHTTRPHPVWMQQCTEKYGKIWGFYEGPKPVLVISDIAYVQDVFVKQFSSFHSRRLFVLQEDSDSNGSVSMFNAHGDRWKRLRTIVNPAFSEFKMRKMFPLIKRCIDVLMSQFDIHGANGKCFNAFDHYKRLTLEVIGECAFGTALNVQTEDRPDSLYAKARVMFETIRDRTLPILLAEAVPELVVPVRKMFQVLASMIPARAAAIFIMKTIRGVIRQRKEDASLRRTDILQLMLDAELPESGALSDVVGRKTLSKEEVAAQSLIFLVAGYETSSNALGILTHVLATHPEVQERAQAEIDSIYANCDNPSQLEESSDHLGSMEYLNSVINESLRCYPIAPQVVSRRCMTAAKIGGYAIPVGTHVMADVLSIHADPAVWGPKDPRVFDPDRFLDGTKREAASFLTFGVGPRFCIGQRFALTEIRAVLFRLLRRYKVRVRDPELRLKYRPTISPAGAVDVILEPRNV